MNALSFVVPPSGGIWSSALVILIDSGLKGLLLLVLATLIVCMMRRASAASRHLVWALALGGLLVLPLLSIVMPKWQLPILPRAPEPVVQVAPARPVMAAQTEAAATSPEPSVIQPAAVVAKVPVGSPAPVFNSMSPAFWIVAAWILIALVAVAPLAGGMIALARLIRAGRRLDHGWLMLVNTLADSIGLERHVDVLFVGRDAMPMATGFVSATVLLPESAVEWTDEKRRTVLLHELAHVKRRDCLTHALARIAVAMHWFNPLAWMALRWLRIERERACDDLVLTAGERPSTYADHLLEIARTMQAGRYASAAAITMAKKSQLEGRLLAVLDPNRNRTAIKRWMFVLGASVACVILFPLAATSVTNASSETESSGLLKQGRPVIKTTLENKGIYWRPWAGAHRNLSFKLSKDEEGDAKDCIRIARSTNSNTNGVMQFMLPQSRQSLEAILKRRPDYFYAEYLLGTWYRLQGDLSTADMWYQRAYQHAPVIIVQQYQFIDGRPLASQLIQSFALECNRVQNSSLDPSLELYYPMSVTDHRGAIYLPAYNTVFRTNDMAYPANYPVHYPSLGWFESRVKVGLLPVAHVDSLKRDKTTLTTPARHVENERVTTSTLQFRWVVKNAEGGKAEQLPYYFKKSRGRVPELWIDKDILLSERDVASVEVQSEKRVESARYGTNYSLRVKFTGEGKKQFERITEQGIGRQIAIIIAGLVVRSPKINEAIRGGELIVTGFTKEEAESLANRIMGSAGAAELPHLMIRFLETKSRVNAPIPVDNAEFGWRIETSETLQTINRGIIMPVDGSWPQNWGSGPNQAGDEGPVDFLIHTRLKGNELVMTTIRQTKSGRTSMEGKHTIPPGAKMEVTLRTAPITIDNRHFVSLWENRIVRDGKTLETVIFAAAAAPMNDKDFEKALDLHGRTGENFPLVRLSDSPDSAVQNIEQKRDGLLLAKVDEAEKIYKDAKAKYEAGVEVRTVVTAAERDYKIAKARLAGDPLAAAQARYDAAVSILGDDKQRYAIGAITRIELSRAEIELKQADYELAKAKQKLGDEAITSNSNDRAATGTLQFRWVAKDAEGGKAEQLPYFEKKARDNRAQPAPWISKEVLLSGKDVASVEAKFDALGKDYMVHLQFTGDARERFARITENGIGRRLAIVVNGQLVSSPVINEPIRGGVVNIQGGFTKEEAEMLAKAIGAGANKPVNISPTTGTLQLR